MLSRPSLLMLGLIAAFHAEARGILSDFTQTVREEKAGVRFLRGRFGSESPVVLGLSGSGPDRASRAAALLIEHYQPSPILSVGTCGAISANLDTGFLVVPQRVQALFLRQEDPLPFPELRIDPDLHRVLDLARNRAGFQGGGDLLLSSDQIVRQPEEKRALADIPGAAAVDMESASIAQVADRAGVPFAAVRAVLDRAWDPLVVNYEEMLKGKAEPNALDVFSYLLVHPFHLGPFLRDCKRVVQAAAALRAFFRAFIEQQNLYA